MFGRRGVDLVKEVLSYDQRSLPPYNVRAQEERVYRSPIASMCGGARAVDDAGDLSFVPGHSVASRGARADEEPYSP